MMRRLRKLLVGLSATFVCAAASMPGFVQAQTETPAQVVELIQVGSSRVDRTTFDYSYRVRVENPGPSLVEAQALLDSAPAGTEVLKGTVALGDLDAGASLTSVDTIVLRQDRRVAFQPGLLVWRVVGSEPQRPTIELGVSDPIVAPGGSVMLAPVVRDHDGQLLDDANRVFTVTVVPVGPVTGNAPQVAGLTVSFPRLEKTLLNANPAIDPAGEFADTDPRDPNYGRETGGRYRITVSHDGFEPASAEVTVIPGGAAGIMVTASRYADRLEQALALARDASETGDAEGMERARTALRSVDANRDFSRTVLGATNSMAPPDGGLPTPALLIAHGLEAGPDDAAYAATLAELTARIRAARSQVAALNVAALDQAAVDALQQAAEAYAAAMRELAGLRPSALGTTRQQAAINTLLADELPWLLDTIKRKAGELLGVTTVASLDGRPWLTAAPAQMAAQAPAQSPAAMYAGVQPVQFYSFFSMSFSIITDLSGTARANIIELSVTLANSLLNIALADAINSGGSGGLAIDYVLGSSSLAFVCPNYTPSRIGGSGFGQNAAGVRVALIGCVGGDLIRNLLTLSKPKNLAAGIRLVNKIVSIANSLSQQGGVAAVVTPDFIGQDDIGLGDDMLYFGAGWPRVNQGRLPCVGVVIVMNANQGTISAQNSNFLGQCG